MEIDEKIKILGEDVIWTFYTIQEYRKIFLDNDNSKIINASAHHFFSNYQRLFWNNIILSISRLFDPPQQRKFNNLTVYEVAQFAENNKLQCACEIKSTIDKIKNNNLQTIKLWRNKMFAHRDIETALNYNYQDMKVHLDDIEEIMKNIGDCLNKIYEENNWPTTSWHVNVFGGAQEIVPLLVEIH